MSTNKTEVILRPGMILDATTPNDARAGRRVLLRVVSFDDPEDPGYSHLRLVNMNNWRSPLTEAYDFLDKYHPIVLPSGTSIATEAA